MSDYTQTNDFSAKDALTQGDPNKIVQGSEVDTELANIATAIATKADVAGDTYIGTHNFSAATLEADAISGAVAPRVLLYDSGDISSGATEVSTGAIFTADYENYELIVNDLLPVSDNTGIRCRFGNGTSYISTSSYRWNAVVDGTAATNTSDTEIHITGNTAQGNSVGERANIHAHIYTPFNSAIRPSIQGTCFYHDTSALPVISIFGGVLFTDAEYDSFRLFYLGASNIEQGRVRIYGLTNGTVA